MVGEVSMAVRISLKDRILRELNAAKSEENALSTELLKMTERLDNLRRHRISLEELHDYAKQETDDASS